jgi:pyruvate formate lyase activating enzyme
MALRGAVFAIQRWSTEDGPGVRTTAFFQGCPLRCAWCCNPESWSAPSQQPGQSLSADQILAEVERDRVFHRQSGGGVTFSGGEATSQPELLRHLTERLSASGVHLVLETCGHFSWDDNEAALRLMDLVYFDLKHMDNGEHERLTGTGNALIFENAVRLAAAGISMIVRLPLIPGYNDSDENLAGTARFVTERLGASVAIEIRPYHALGRHKHQAIGEPFVPPTVDAVLRARRQLEAAGARVLD